MHTTYEAQISQEATSIYENNKLFSKDSIEEDRIAPVVISRLSKRIKKMEEGESTGAKWFNMKKKTLTPELKDELNIIKLRGMINPKVFSKKPDWDGLPEYFQIGTVVGGGDEPKSMKLKKRDKKGTIIDQFLSDDKDLSWSKGKFSEIQSKKKRITRKKLDMFKKLKKRGVVRG